MRKIVYIPKKIEEVKKDNEMQIIVNKDVSKELTGQVYDNKMLPQTGLNSVKPTFSLMLSGIVFISLLVIFLKRKYVLKYE